MENIMSIIDSIKDSTDADAIAGDSHVRIYEKQECSNGPGIVSHGHFLAISIQLEELYSGHNCRHQRWCPTDYKTESRIPQEPAKTYKFELDEFQKRSVECLENNESVLVCAHTSAGKTAIAEYAIAMGLRDKGNIIYTSPIKALSNQKYRSLVTEFHDVGLMTGDVTINPNASVMVMTTEILRSMLYRGSEIVQAMKWVIFDEVHYMRDAERGVVWEETIILIPQNVNLVFLSATIPNHLEFAEWVCRIKNKPCNVISTDYRPTPLQHYVYPSKAAGIFLVLDENNKFHQDDFLKAVSMIECKDVNSRTKRTRDTDDTRDIVSLCHDRKLTPVIVFGFSKANCEANAQAVKDMVMTEESERNIIVEIYLNAMATLSEEDRKLPQAVHILPLLKNGIGIHHGGLLPIIREMVEILFQEGLLKILFSTETFAMGVNMPAKSVVFTKLTKWDGTQVRKITCGEYIQMAGRAGRRGLDNHGYVIIMLKEGLKPEEAKSIFLGKSNPLQSSFHLGYNMLLNLMRIEDTSPEYLIERSFLQFQMDAKARDIETKLGTLLHKIQAAKSKIDQSLFENLLKVHNIEKEIKDLETTLSQQIMQDAKVLNFINFGRCLYIQDQNVDWGWGICFGSAKVKISKSQKVYIVDVLVPCDLSSVRGKDSFPPKPMHKIQEATFQIVPFTLGCIRHLSQVKMAIGTDFRPESQVAQAKMRIKFAQLHDYIASLPTVPLLDPIEHLKIDTPKVQAIVRKLGACKQQLEQQPVCARPDFAQLRDCMAEYVRLEDYKRELLESIENSRRLVLLEELGHMKGVLKALGYVNEHGLVTIKGRIACEINATDELLVAEMFLRNFFDGMSPEYICASLSCLVIDETKEDVKQLKDPKLIQAYIGIRSIAAEIASVMQEHKINLVPAEFVNKFKPTLMTSVLRWANGEAFHSILADSNVFEGSIIRCVRFVICMQIFILDVWRSF
ncbi:bifunctional ATP-dependent RNA helicase Ski2-like/ATP-dependent RNA helicase Ski2 [Babesia duncani]|uniref:Bifunctional ATP-dependent RNA helicase Ski2-like/ATP-dependent RNA helicase Ski2 n=1 Tax=Babesia duncani TaxID=323732 RepID=A0AAD9UN90_9APIC|nr:bifunctional ATP-dependent RNA helicase Ski2-like/ATP-dependent RNA helicase Ski2 [Babesia duncani]